MEPIMYSTGCPKCNVLKRKLEGKNIAYTENTSIDEMKALGIMSVPVLKVEDRLLRFADALQWVQQQ